MGIAGILVATAVVGGTMADFTAKSEQGKTDITTKSLGITLEDDAVPKCMAIEELEMDKLGMPGDEIEMPYRIRNDVPDGYDLYTRVTIYKSWGKHDEKLDSSMIKLFVYTDSDEPQELTCEDGNPKMLNDWIVWYSDDEQVIAYYTKPLTTDPNDWTTHIFDLVSISPEITNAYTGQTVKLEIKADAVQTAVAESSIPSEWGVYPTFDEAGNIVSIAE